MDLLDENEFDMYANDIEGDPEYQASLITSKISNQTNNEIVFSHREIQLMCYGAMVFMEYLKTSCKDKNSRFCKGLFYEERKIALSIFDKILDFTTSNTYNLEEAIEETIEKIKFNDTFV